MVEAGRRAQWGMMIHDDHPFLPDRGARDPVRRLRGRLASPVTIITAGEGRARTGLTVSSLAVVEGEPPLVYAFVGTTSDLWEMVSAAGRFVVHVLGEGQTHLADVFAGLRPSPGGLFNTAQTVDSPWGPVISDVPDRAYCTLVSREEVAFSGVVIGTIDGVEVSELSDPLVYFRAGYRKLS